MPVYWQLGGVLTQQVEGRGAPVGYSCRMFSGGEEKLSPNDGEVSGVLQVLDHSSTYLDHQRFTLVTDRAARFPTTFQELKPVTQSASLGDENDAV